MSRRPAQDPYALCSCGSGKKFKFCCRGGAADQPFSSAPSLATTAQDLRDLFSEPVRRAGEKLARLNRVAPIVAQPDLIEAIVSDGGPRFAGVVLDDEGLGWKCNCPQARNPDPCAHVWAVLCLAAREGVIEPLGAETAVSWRELFERVGPRGVEPYASPAAQTVFWLDLKKILESRAGLELFVGSRRPLKAGGWGMISMRQVRRSELSTMPDGPDRRALQILFGTEDNYYLYGSGARRDRFDLNEGLANAVLPLLARSGRLFLHDGRESWEGRFTPLAWQEEPWRLKLAVEAAPQERGSWRFAGRLERADGLALKPTEPALALRAGLLVAGDALAPFHGSFDWLTQLRDEPEIRIPASEAAAFRKSLYALPDPPDVEWPEALRPEEVRASPSPRMKIVSPPKGWTDLRVEAAFDYGGIAEVAPEDRRAKLLDEAGRRVTPRDFEAEKAALGLLGRLGFKDPARYARDRRLALAPKKLPAAVRNLLEAGWQVEAENVLYRRATGFRMGVATGIDWFDLSGGVEFGSETVPFPRLLAAARKRETFVALGDGSFGVIPEEWLKRVSFLVDAAEPEGDALRYRKSQALLLDALLAAEPKNVSSDEAFARLREKLGGFAGIRPADAPTDFVGTLRPYQREGLGWMRFLGELGFGGCLADDMGLGKTVQVLALLADSKGPSLVVVPRSLVFNWKAEAFKFAPKLRVLDHTGVARAKDLSAAFRNADVVLTTYGTLRRDAPALKDFEFEYAILDESQAIKNAQSATAKAARLIRARRRLALSGTPIENDLGELWSLFEFLNPGMLGRAGVFESCLDSAAGDDEARALLGRALRPFLLRRTKAQVARDLPDKVEQLITCELEPAQRKYYDELREHYRAALLGRLDEAALRRAKFQVLEALLRLRQAALHPGLIDPKLRGESSVKLEILLEQAKDALAEGHKALVFSQFTSMLSIVRERLDAEKIPYDYLDGSTRDREAVVKRFQAAPDPRLFLISLKAGGQGLNLTAAEYVFLLDPWWNPAVEAQAVDRTHRIGQTRRVFTIRLVARDTVEEKVLQLQASKRAVAEAILGEDKSLIASLSREDLELLLS